MLGGHSILAGGQTWKHLANSEGTLMRASVAPPLLPNPPDIILIICPRVEHLVAEMACYFHASFPVNSNGVHDADLLR